MRSKIGAGVIAGLAGGVTFGMVMQIIPLPTGGRMINQVAMLIGARSAMAGWIVHMAISAAIGALFGALFGRFVRSYGLAAALGVAYGFAWWIVGGLVLMPLALGARVFAPISMELWRPIGFISMIGHMLYGFVLGVMYASFWQGVVLARPTDEQAPRIDRAA